jgi:hypothetical protein
MLVAPVKRPPFSAGPRDSHRLHSRLTPSPRARVSLGRTHRRVVQVITRSLGSSYRPLLKLFWAMGMYSEPARYGFLFGHWRRHRFREPSNSPR